MKSEVETPCQARIGDNSENQTLKIEIKLFNALTSYAGTNGTRRIMELPVGITVREIAALLSIPSEQLFLVLANGRDVTPGLVGDAVNGSYQIEDGDVIALSGPMPYSYGYGAPVV